VALKVLHVFDKYLNRTMNWAHRLIGHTPDTEVFIAAPIIVENEFYDSRFTFWKSPFQWQSPKDEWSVGRLQNLVAIGFYKKTSFYRSFLKKRIKKEKIDVIHAHFGQVGVELMDIAKELNIPLVVTFYGYDFQVIPNKKPEYKSYYKKLFGIADKVLCLGSVGKERLVSMGCPSEKIQVNKLAIEPHKIEAGVREKRPNQLTMLQAGTITEKKGHIYTINAFIQCLSKCPNQKLYIVGEEQDLEITNALKSLVAQHQLENKVIFKPVMDYTELLDMMRSVDVFIHPSCFSKTGDCEGGTPVVLQDAMATGLPIISSFHVDIPEGVLDGKTGILAEEKDVAALAKAIQRFYEMNNDTYHQFSSATRQHVETNYDVRQSGIQLAKVYESVCV